MSCELGSCSKSDTSQNRAHVALHNGFQDSMTVLPIPLISTAPHSSRPALRASTGGVTGLWMHGDQSFTWFDVRAAV